MISLRNDHHPRSERRLAAFPGRVTGLLAESGQRILTDTVLHGAMAPVLSLSRQRRTEAARPDPPVTLVVMTIEADCPGFTKPGSHEGVSELMARPFGSTHGGLPTTSALVTSVIMRSSGADSAPLLVSVKTNVSVWPV